MEWLAATTSFRSGCDCDLGGLSGVDELLIFSADVAVVSGGDNSGDAECLPHLSASASEEGLTFSMAGLSSARCKACARRDLPAPQGFHDRIEAENSTCPVGGKEIMAIHNRMSLCICSETFWANVEIGRGNTHWYAAEDLPSYRPSWRLE